LLVATGIIFGSWLAQRRADQAKIDSDEVRGAVAWAVVVGFIGAHLFTLLFYKSARLGQEGFLLVLKVWDGISSMGGFLGALAGLYMYFGRASRPAWAPVGFLAGVLASGWLGTVNALAGQITFAAVLVALFIYYRKSDKPWLGHAEIVLQALVLGWVFGRAGCTVAFDHPGAITDFFLGEQYGEAGPFRHNLGFYEFLYTLFVLLPLTLILHRVNPPRGTILGAISMAYAVVRFGLDFLRAEDVEGADTRLAGLTPAQYACVALFLFGAWMILRVRRLARVPGYPRVRMAAGAEPAALPAATPSASTTPTTTRPERPAAKRARKSRA
jgi:phosphatidylglycerol:prolipoprotein diacylglycerol transferase